MSSHKMKAELRASTGSNKVKKLRANNVLPGVIYKKGKDTVSVQVSESEFLKTYKQAGSTSVIYLELDGKSYPVIIKDMQRDPVLSNITHIDFQELNMNETVKLFVPVHLVNRDNIRLQPSVLNQMLEQVEVECLPSKIPNTGDVDVANMNYGDAFYVKDLDIADMEGITVLTDLETVVCTLLEPAAMEVEPEEEPLIAPTETASSEEEA